MVTTEATLNHSKYGTGDRVHRLGEFTSYREAEHMVDRLSGVGVPAERVRIVGTRMLSVEQVTGRLAKVRATLIGAGLGAWLGLVTGLVTGLLLALSGAGLVWLTAMLGGPLIGAAFGAALGFITYWATDGRRDSASTTDLQARRYAVEIDSAHATEDVQTLDRSRPENGVGPPSGSLPTRLRAATVRARPVQVRR